MRCRAIAAITAVACVAVVASARSRMAFAQVAPARAAPPSPAELAAARQLFGEGLRASDAGRWREALGAFQRVERIITSPQVHYQIGVCHERLGELVEALNEFEMAIQEAEVKRAPDVVRESRAHADAIRRKVARVVIRVPPDAKGVSVTIDGRPIHVALLGTAMPVNPGDRAIAVRAENYASAFTTTLRLGPNDERAIDATLGEKKKKPTATAHPPPPPPTAAPSPPPLPKRSYVPVIITGSVTFALTVGATATGIAAHADYTQYIRENATPPTTPKAEREALRSAGIGKAWASTALTLASLAGAGVTIYFVVRAPESPGPRVSWAPWASPDGGGVSLRGSL